MLNFRKVDVHFAQVFSSKIDALYAPYLYKIVLTRNKSEKPHKSPCEWETSDRDLHPSQKNQAISNSKPIFAPDLKRLAGHQKILLVVEIPLPNHHF